MSDDLRFRVAGQAVPSGEPEYKWDKEEETCSEDAEDTGLFAGV